MCLWCERAVYVSVVLESFLIVCLLCERVVYVCLWCE